MTSREPVETKEVNGEIIMHWKGIKDAIPKGIRKRAVTITTTVKRQSLL